MQRNPSSGDLSNPESARRGRRQDSDRKASPEFSQLPSCGDFDMRIARDGTWFYRGSPIGRKPLVKLFSTVLRRENGEFWLVTPVERGRILVDDAPFVAVAVEAAGAGRGQVLTFRTNVDDEVIVDAAHPLRISVNPARGESVPYVTVRNGLEARILRPVYYHLVELGEFAVIDGVEQLGVWSAGTFFSLGGTEEN